MYKGITKNSKEVKEGYIYCCFEGKVSGYNFIDEAINKGACLIIGEKDIDLDIYLKVDNVNLEMIKYAKKISDNADLKLDLIAVTGTDGKTSIATIIHKILSRLSSSSYLGTNGFWIDEKELDYNNFTTPFADKTFEYLKKSVDNGSKYFVMEVSSHALKQERLKGLKFKSAIFSNLSEEHLDFHKNMEDYYESKKKLFLENDTYNIINIDDVYGNRLKDEVSNVISISKMDKRADYYFYEEVLSTTGTEFKLKVEGREYFIKSPLLADFNIYNLVEAIACLNSLGYKMEEIIPCLDEVFIPGRLERINNKLGLNILIDFAHTADAISKVMEFIKKYNKEGKIHVLTGSAGGRDSLKRSKMGENASMYADYLYLTEDDPRDEKVNDINNEIKKGIKNSKCEVFEIEKRKDAIRKMIENSQKHDTLVLFGKGEMKKMYYDGYAEDYFEKDVLEKVLEEIK